MAVGADAFDEPPDSPSHTRLRDTAWMGGELTEGRYFLSWATGVNEFRRSHEEFDADYREFVIKTWPESQVFLKSNSWRKFFLVLLRHRYWETEVGKNFPFRSESKHEKALRTLLTNPSLTQPELAKALKTTEKQLLRMPDIQEAFRDLIRNTANSQSTTKQRKG